MSTELQITDELVNEFIFNYASFVLKDEVKRQWEQFKESKQPKPEWEIIQVANPECGLYYLEGHKLRENDKIYSVKRISDGEIFTIEDRFRNDPDSKQEYTIREFEIQNGLIKVYAKEYGFDWLKDLIKVKKILFTTEDGKDVFEGDKVCLLSTETWLYSWPITAPQSPFKGDKDQFKYFSCPEEADEYKLQNQPLFSLQEIKTIGNVGENNPYYKKLVALAESKLKQ